MYDEDAWLKYPHHHNWFNKLYVAEQMGYYCGPCGFAPSRSDYYIVRPIYNLGGMGVGTSIQYIEADDYTMVPPGYFWCEILLGKQYSATYEFVSGDTVRVVEYVKSQYSDSMGENDLYADQLFDHDKMAESEYQNWLIWVGNPIE